MKEEPSTMPSKTEHELEELLRAASHLNFWKPEGKHGIGSGGMVIFCGSFNEYGCGDTANRDLVVAAVNALPALLAERKRLREGLRNLVAMVEENGPDYTDADAMQDARIVLEGVISDPYELGVAVHGHIAALAEQEATDEQR